MAICSFFYRLKEIFSKLSKPHISIIINGDNYFVDDEVVSYNDIVYLASGKEFTSYSIVFKKGPHINREGILAVDRSVYVQDGMVFNTSRTTGS